MQFVSLSVALSLSMALAPVPVLAAVQDPATMSDEDKMNRAKQLYGEGDAAYNEGDAATALAKFEEAYNTYAPSLHVFNMNIGLAAHDLGDCVKAKTAFQRFLDLVPEHPSRGQAQEKLLEIERSGCATAQPEPEPAPITTTTAPAAEYDNQDAPELTSRRSEREEEIEKELDEEDANRASGKLIAGAALTALGGAALIGGGVSLGIANSRANTLAELASPGPTGFPEGDFSDEVASIHTNGLPAANTAAVALFIGGGVMAAVGVTLIVLDRKGKGKKDTKNARRPGPRLTGIGPSVMRGGGGASATLRF